MIERQDNQGVIGYLFSIFSKTTKTIHVCEHSLYAAECFHSIWGYGEMCHNCKKVLHYTSLRRDMPRDNACKECHYNKDYYDEHDLGSHMHELREVVDGKRQVTQRRRS